MQIGSGTFDVRNGVQGFGEKPTADPKYVDTGTEKGTQTDAEKTTAGVQTDKTPPKPSKGGWFGWGSRKAEASDVAHEVDARVNGKLSPVVPEYIEETWKEKHPTGLRGWMKGFGEGAQDFGKGISGLAGAAGSVANAFGKVVAAPINAATMALGLQERRADLAHKNESYERGKTREDWELERNKKEHTHHMTRAEWEMERDKALHERHKTKEDWEMARDKETHTSNMDTAKQNREHAKQSHKLAIDRGEEDLAATKARDSYIGKEKDQAISKANLDYLSQDDARNRLLEEDKLKQDMVWWDKLGMKLDIGTRVVDGLAGAGGKFTGQVIKTVMAG
jgi:hypothetical protein